ncbi:hypothetical protein B0I35DRAFT_477147 [Stachybotrys elegans]|uniref:Cytochrome b561 domain-containing protein n=1 Tax=Stachybotrys elegans TaxID=80388 RepID=A0A8K0SSQ1_9HYPO|nr:hypothetical protein B0I35DRAFT_477147 [Stachybotrys elegans]
MTPTRLLLLGLGLLCTSALGAIQYCHKDELANICLGIVGAKNESSSGVDLYVTLGYEGTATTGWMAMGIGEQMAGALMFLIIADQSKNAVLSVRTTAGHFQPQEAPDKTPAAELLSINSQTDTWQEYAFVCYSCDSWATFNPTEKSHPLIWARELKQTFEVATSDARIHQHDHYSLFWADMTASAPDAGQAAAPPTVDRSKGTFGASDFGAPADGSESESDPGFTAARAHGLLLGFAFMILFPAGAAVFSTGYSKSFVAHVTIQLTAMVCAFSGVGLMLWPIIANNGFERLLEAHPALGSVLMALVGIQIWLGWWHHKNFVKYRRRTAPSFAHRWNGRLLLVLGTANTAFGLVFAKERASARMVWGTLAAVEAIVLLIVVPELARRKEQMEDASSKQKVEGDERGHLLSEGSHND